ncbi:MAG: hypothetical protein ACRDYE_03030 [Acidimicrobiales bacterium]
MRVRYLELTDYLAIAAEVLEVDIESDVAGSLRARLQPPEEDPVD